MDKSGWVIRDEYGFRHRTTGEYVTAFSWWYGPDRSWGNTWGSPDSAATWPTKKAAETAAAEAFGIGWKFDPRRDRRRKAQTYSDAEAQAADRLAAYLLRSGTE